MPVNPMKVSMLAPLQTSTVNSKLNNQFLFLLHSLESIDNRMVSTLRATNPKRYSSPVEEKIVRQPP